MHSKKHLFDRADVAGGHLLALVLGNGEGARLAHLSKAAQTHPLELRCKPTNLNS